MEKWPVVIAITKSLIGKTVKEVIEEHCHGLFEGSDFLVFKAWTSPHGAEKTRLYDLNMTIEETDLDKNLFLKPIKNSNQKP